MKMKSQRGSGNHLQLKVDRESFPNVEGLLKCKTPAELLSRYGIDLPRDLPWPTSYQLGMSGRASIILEALGRGGFPTRPGRSAVGKLSLRVQQLLHPWRRTNSGK